MDDTSALETLKQRHEALYTTAIQERAVLQRDDGRRERFLAQVDGLLQQVGDLSRHVTSIKDYSWLTDMSLKWQLVFSTVLNLPMHVALPSAPERIEAVTAVISDEQIEMSIRERALQQSLIRKASQYLGRLDVLLQKVESTKAEMQADWESSVAVFVYQLFEGQLKIGPASFHWLEDEWISEVKRTKAYFLWLSNPDKVRSQGHQEDYDAALDWLRGLLVDPRMKGSQDFEPYREYIETRYLTDGRFDPAKGKAHDLVARKAYRIWRTTGETDERKNWEHAETYCRMFYDHVIPAVAAFEEEPRAAERVEHTLLALKAFQYSKARENRFLVINCFEVALALYFLDPEIVEQLWRDSGEMGDRDYTVTTVWAGGLARVPARFEDRMTLSDGHLVLHGVLTEAERDRLIARFPEHQEVFAELFRQSRLLPRRSTL